MHLYFHSIRFWSKTDYSIPISPITTYFLREEKKKGGTKIFPPLSCMSLRVLNSNYIYSQRFCIVTAFSWYLPFSDALFGAVTIFLICKIPGILQHHSNNNPVMCMVKRLAGPGKMTALISLQRTV